MFDKGIKIFGKVLSLLVLLAIILPVTVSLLLMVPTVQNFVVHKAAEIVSRKLETTVSIDRIDVGMLGKIKLRGFYVEDYQRDTLIYAGRLEAYVTGLGIFGGGVSIGRAKLADAKLHLHETQEGVLNIKQVVERLSKKEQKGKGNFMLAISSLDVENLEFCLEKYEHKDPSYGIDFSHLHLDVSKAAISDFGVDGGAIHGDIEHLAATEQSGFRLNDLSGRFYVVSGAIGLENTVIVTEDSNIELPHVSIIGESWDIYKDFIDKVEIDAALRNSSVSTDDLAYFAPSLRTWRTLFSNADIDVRGVVADFAGRVNSLSAGADTELEMDFKVTGLPDIKTTHFDVDLTRLSTAAADIDELATKIARQTLSSGVLRIADSAGEIRLDGRFEGELSSFGAKMTVRTSAGRADCNLRLTPAYGGRSKVNGSVSTTDLMLGTLLRNKLIGVVSVKAEVDGVIGRGFYDASVDGEVSQIVVKGHRYDAVKFDGHLRNKAFDGAIRSSSPDLDFDFAGMLDMNDSIPKYDFRLDLKHADLARMRINPRDTVSVLSLTLVANAAGRSLDDLNGDITINNAIYRYNADTVRYDNISIVGRNSPNSKYVKLTSGFADVAFRSKTSYKNVFSYLKSSMRDYLPLLYKQDAKHSAVVPKSEADDYSLLSVDVKNIYPITDAVAKGLQIANGSKLQLLFNPASNRLSLQVSSDFIERNKMLVTKLNMNVTNQGDSLKMYASAEDVYAGAFHTTSMSIMGGAKNNRVQLSAGFRDTVSNLSGIIGFVASIDAEKGVHGRNIGVKLTPSHITRGKETWQIFARNIEIDSTRILIDKFYIMNDKQELIVDGVASRSREDSVTLRLRNFNLAPLAQPIAQMGYIVEGRTNGRATVKSALKASEVTADIKIDSLKVNDMPAPPLQLTSLWDFERNRAGVFVMDTEARDTLLRGYYVPSQVRYYAKATFDSLNMGLLDPVLKGVVSDTGGYADAELVLTGEKREAELRGEIRVKGFSTKVDYTQVVYSMPEAVVEVRNNILKVENALLTDPKGNKGAMNLELDLAHLSNIAYSLSVAPDKMMVLNTTAKDNDLFYGRVFATGQAIISGNKAGVKMDITASTDDNTEFFMPLSGKSNIKSADFVIFEKPSAKSDTTNYLVRKKMMFEREQKTKSASGGGMDINLTINVRPSADFQLIVNPSVGDALTARGDGVLNLHINPKAGIFQMSGDYTLVEGKYRLSLLNIISKTFEIESGSSIQWTGEPLDALLNINAVYKLKTSLTPLLGSTGTGRDTGRQVPVDCVIHIGDRLSNPTYRFDIRVPTVGAEAQTAIVNALNTPEAINQQVMYLLATGTFYPENANATSQNLGISTASSSIEMITNQLSNMLSGQNYSIMFNYRPQTELTGDEVDLGFSTGLINNRLLIELEGNYVVDNKQAATNRNMSNFMGEAYITWLLDRSGALKLKVFTQTMDRFDENQGLQETGIGIYYREDFNSFRDLGKKFKDRFSSEKRKERRAERVVERQRRAEEAAKGSASGKSSD